MPLICFPPRECKAKKAFPEITLTIKHILLKSTVLFIAKFRPEKQAFSHHIRHRESEYPSHCSFSLSFCWPFLNYFWRWCFFELSLKHFSFSKISLGIIFMEDGKKKLRYSTSQTDSFMYVYRLKHNIKKAVCGGQCSVLELIANPLQRDRCWLSGGVNILVGFRTKVFSLLYYWEEPC